MKEGFFLKNCLILSSFNVGTNIIMLFVAKGGKIGKIISVDATATSALPQIT